MFKGIFIAQVIGVIGSLVLAKLYGSQAFGVFGVFISLSSMFSIINTLQYDNCLVTIKNDNERKNLLSSLFFMNLISVVFIVLAVFTASTFITLQSHNFFIIYLALIGSIFFSFNKTHELYLTHKERFNPISNAKIITILLSLVFQITLFYFYKINGLIYGNIISIIVISIYYFYLNKDGLRTIDFKLLKETLRINDTIVKHLFPANLINNIAINITPILISFYFGIEFYGVYYLSIKILSTPLFLITSSVAQVFYKESDKILKTKPHDLFELTKKVVLTNIGIMFVFLILLNTVGIYILEIILNKNWENLRLYTLILSFLILAKSAFTPISDIIIVLNKNHISLIFSFYLLIINFLGFYIGYSYDNIILALCLITIFGGFGYLLQLFYVLNLLKKEKSIFNIE
jgi:O-antigen/teichoic acid export membrane protein